MSDHFHRWCPDMSDLAPIRRADPRARARIRADSVGDVGFGESVRDEAGRVSVFAEFVGGPLDGRIIEIPKAEPQIHVPLPLLGHYLTSADPSQLHYGKTVYERSERREMPTGDLIFRYRNESVQ